MCGGRYLAKGYIINAFLQTYIHFLLPCDEANKPDYGEFNETVFTPRNGNDHKRLAFQSLNLRTLTELEKESSDGLPFSELYLLPYFDPIRNHVIDPMHNLMLGVAKHTFHTWVNTGILNETKLLEIDEVQKQIKIPLKVGRLDTSISGLCYIHFYVFVI